MNFLLCVLVQYPAQNMGCVSYSVSFSKKGTTRTLIYRAECAASHVDGRVRWSVATRAEFSVRLHQKCHEFTNIFIVRHHMVRHPRCKPELECI